jgi:hypothetical protein
LRGLAATVDLPDSLVQFNECINIYSTNLIPHPLSIKPVQHTPLDRLSELLDLNEA